MDNKKLSIIIAGLPFRDRLILAYFAERATCSSKQPSIERPSPQVKASQVKTPPC